MPNNKKRKRFKLTWHKGINQWQKMTNNKVTYYGTGKGKYDTEGYKNALAKYEDHMRSLNQEPATTRVQPTKNYKPRQDGVSIINGARVAQDRDKEVYAPTDKVHGIIDRYFDSKQLQFAAKGNATSSRLNSIKWCLNDFSDFVGPYRKTEHLNEARLTAYHNNLVTRMTHNKLAADSANQKLSYAKDLIRWAWEQRYIDELPRNFRRLSISIPDKEPSIINTYTIGECRKFLDYTGTKTGVPSDRTLKMRCYVAIAINLGYDNSMISSLRVADLKGNRIVHKRKKTGVISNHLLLNFTADLIERTRARKPIKDAQGYDLLFKSESNQPLVCTRFENKKQTGNNAICSQFRLFRKKVLGEEECRTFRDFRKTGATLISEITNGDLHLEQLYLAHSMNSVARKHYVNISYEPLDEAIIEMGKRLLELPAAMNVA